MLVLSRRLGETIVIDGGIRVTVVAIEGNHVRLGIAAPKSVRVDRQEVHERIVQFLDDSAAGLETLEDSERLLRRP
jgi:carbon storage regulator